MYLLYGQQQRSYEKVKIVEKLNGQKMYASSQRVAILTFSWQNFVRAFQTGVDEICCKRSNQGNITYIFNLLSEKRLLMSECGYLQN